jgi:hypothetical protein
MSSPAGAQAGGDAGPAQGEAQGQEQGGQDAVLQQLQAMQQGQEELRTYLASEPWQQRQEAAEEDEGAEEQPLDLSFLDVGDPGYDPQQTAQQLQTLLDSRVNEGIKQALGPVQQQVQDMQRTREAEALVQEFPDIAQPEVAQQVVQTAREYAELMGRPDLGDDPKFWRIIYAAGRTFDQAKQEGSGDPGAAHLEGGAGAAPGGQGQVDLAKLIVNGGGDDRALGARVLDFGT